MTTRARQAPQQEREAMTAAGIRREPASAFNPRTGLRHPVEIVPPGQFAPRRPTRAGMALLRDATERSARQVQQVSATAMRALAPVLQQAERETAAGLRVWLASVPDGELRFTAQRYRAVMLHLRTALDTIRATNPALARALGIASRSAGRLSVEHLTSEVARFSSVFVGSEMHLQLNMARILATGERALIPRIRTSAARYTGNVLRDIQQQLAIGTVRGETVSALTDRLVRLGGPRGTVALRGVAGEEGAITEVISGGLFRRYRDWAERVVRTETMASYSLQKDDAYAEALEEIPDLKRRWDATSDRVCDRCSSSDGQIAEVGGTFANGVESPPLHPRCRCVTTPYRDEWRAMGIVR